jgi:hypothetical protein
VTEGQSWCDALHVGRTILASSGERVLRNLTTGMTDCCAPAERDPMAVIAKYRDGLPPIHLRRTATCKTQNLAFRV